MPAPTKEGLDYFPFDVDLLDNDDLDFLREKYGVVVNDVYIALLTLLYRKKGYYIPYETEAEQNDCIWYVFKRVRGGKYPVKQEAIPRVIEAIVAQGLFSGSCFPKIITSERAQRTYYSATVERKLESFNIIPEYWLLDDETMRKLSKVHPYYLSLRSKGKSDEKPSKSDEKPSKSDEKPLNKSKVNNNTPYIPLKGGRGGEREGKAEFMKVYPLLAEFKSPYDDSGIDYKVLSDRFSKSERLRKTYSMKWVCENYSAIKDGLFTDKEDGFSNAEWQQWNSDRRHAAEDKAENALARATADNEYCAIYSELQSLNVQLAFAEVKDKAKAVQIAERIKELESQGDRRLTELGIDNADFTPHYSCKTCNDTGYTAQGLICESCLKNFKEKRNNGS